MSGIIGRKCGTTRMYTENGGIRQVTLIAIEPNHITAIKQSEKDGYSALQLASVEKPKNTTKPEKGYFDKRNIAVQKVVNEYRVESDDQIAKYEVGQVIDVDLFKEGKLVNVASMSKGKGFAGCIKRHNFRRQPASHGTSKTERAPGSTGQCQFPGRVNPGKKMPGRMGYAKRTVKNLEVVSVRKDDQLLVISGSVPGPRNAIVYITAKELLKGE